jgi:hypothetical protein
MKILCSKNLPRTLFSLTIAITLLLGAIELSHAVEDKAACGAALTKWNDEVPKFLEKNRDAVQLFKEQLAIIKIPGGKYKTGLSRQDIQEMMDASGLSKKELEKAYKMMKKAEQLEESYNELGSKVRMMSRYIKLIKKRAAIVTNGCK